jgi:hypothetical protein
MGGWAALGTRSLSGILMKNIIASTVLALGCVHASIAATSTPPHRSVYKPALVLQWKDRLHVASTRLQEGKWNDGMSIASSVLREMRDRIVSGEATGDLLAVALLFRSIAEAGLGEREDAAWDFGVAQTLYPSYERVDLKPYGAAAALLDEFRYHNGEPPMPAAWLEHQPGAQDHVTPPRKLSGKSAEYPLAKAASCIEKTILVGSIINERGYTESPSLPEPTDPVLALAAFDAIRTWRFEPAQQAGKPAPVHFVLSVNFKTPQCY